jgi:hypothetical protein
MNTGTKVLILVGGAVVIAGVTYYFYREEIKKKVNNFFNDPDKYYVGRVLPKSYFEFWKKFENSSPTEKRVIRGKMEEIIKGSMIRAKKHFIKWYSNPMTINKLPKNEQYKLDSLKNDFIPSIEYHINYDKSFTNNKEVQDAYAYVSSATPNIIFINVYNFWTGDFKGEVGLYDTVTHEMSHSIDYFLNENGVTLYQKTSNLESSGDSYIMNDQEQFARLSTFRRQFEVSPLATYIELADVFRKAIKTKKIVSKDFDISVTPDSNYLVFTPKKGRVVINAKTKIDRLNQIWQIFFFDIKLFVDGRTDANLNPLFTNFAQITNGSVYVDLRPLAQLNVTTAGIENKSKINTNTNILQGNDNQGIAFTGKN